MKFKVNTIFVNEILCGWHSDDYKNSKHY